MEFVDMNISVKKQKHYGLRLLFLVFLYSGSVHADITTTTLPTGGVVSLGEATISSSGATMNIAQTSDRASINWQSHDIGRDATVNIIQPSANSVLLSRVQSTNPSQIFGTLNANGKLILINSAGIIFGEDANFNGGSLIASTMDMSDKDFLEGKYIFSRNESTGTILNQGTLAAADGGIIALLAPTVVNDGIIKAKMGSVVLAAGEKITLDFNGGNLINIVAEPAAVETLVENKKFIQADGGKVYMRASAAGELIGNVVNTGTISANSIARKNGGIYLKASTEVNVGGTINAAGGIIAIKADKKVVVKTKLNLSGNTTIKAGEAINIEADIVNTAGSVSLDAPSITGGEHIISSDIAINLLSSAIINITALAPKVELYTNLYIKSSIVSNDYVTIDGNNLKVTYLKTSSLTLKTYGALTTDQDVILTADKLTLVANKFGSDAIPIQVTTNSLDIKKVTGDINIIESTDIDESIKIRGPPDKGFGAIIYNQDASVAFYAPNGDVIINDSVTLTPKTSKLFNLKTIIPATWIGGLDGDHLWGTPENWSDNAAPSDASYVVTIPDGSTVITTTPITVGELNLEGASTLTLGADFTLDNSSDATGNLNIATNSAFITSDDVIVNVAGNVVINGTFAAAGANVAVNVGGDWDLNSGGVFNSGSSTVEFVDDTKDSNITGNSTFYNLTCITPGKTLIFAARSLTTISSLLTIMGSVDNYVTLKSSVKPINWLDVACNFNIAIDAVSNGQGDNYLEYLEVYYSSASGPAVPILAKNYCIAAEFNPGWDDEHTWTGSGADSNWSTAANWGGFLPGTGDVLKFPADALQKTNINDFAANTSFTSIIFNGNGYALSGNAITLTGGAAALTDSSTSGNNTIGLDITAPSATVAVTNASETLIISSSISSSGSFKKTGQGVLKLWGSNTYTYLSIIEGTISVFSSNSLGLSLGNTMTFGSSSTVGTLCNAGSSSIPLAKVSLSTGGGGIFNAESTGKISIDGFTTNTGSLTINCTGTGAVELTGSSSRSGVINIIQGILDVLNSYSIHPNNTFVFGGSTSSGTLRLTYTGTLGLSLSKPVSINAGGAILNNTRDNIGITISGAISGVGGLTVASTGSGAVTLSGANSYSGGTIVNSGILNVNSANAVGTGNLTLNSGKFNQNATPFNLLGNLSIATNAIFTKASGGQIFTLSGSNQSISDNHSPLNNLGNVVISGTGVTTMMSNLTLTSLSIDSNKIFDPKTYQTTISGAFTVNGTINVGAATFGYNFSKIPTLNSGSTVNYNANANQTIKGLPYQNLIVSGGGNKTIETGASIASTGTINDSVKVMLTVVAVGINKTYDGDIGATINILNIFSPWYPIVYNYIAEFSNKNGNYSAPLS